MKIFLAGVWLFSISLSAMAMEQTSEERFTTLQRFGVRAEWDGNKSPFPQVATGAERKGVLTIAQIGVIESIYPYPKENGRTVARPAVIDDLFYESLMLPDPVGGSGRMYPLIAKAVRLPADLSYAIFELDSRVRFQDGTAVTSADILFSLERLKASAPEIRQWLDVAVAKITFGAGLEVRFDLHTKNQGSRDVLMLLAGLKIVKPNSTGATLVGGIPVPFTSTGPYRLTQLGRGRLGLIIDPSYWGNTLAVRQGFFNFRVVEVSAVEDVAAARLALLNDGANFYPESQAHLAGDTQEMLIPQNPKIERADEDAPENGRPFSSLAFHLHSPAVKDWRVRAALLLAYDFDTLNSVFFGGTLKRPASLLENSPLRPRGNPSPEVKAIMDTCQTPDVGSFEDHGHSKFRAIGDKRIRLLTAMRLLQEAGYKVENGSLKRPLPNGEYIPVKLRLLVRLGEAAPAQFFKEDLNRLGISLETLAVPDPAFETLRSSGNYDLVSASEGFVTVEGWPSPAASETSIFHRLPCMDAMARTLSSEPAYSDLYRNTAEALARVHQALHVSIFRGDQPQKIYFKDRRLKVPEGLSNQGIHLYGYWNETVPSQAASWNFQNDYFPPEWGDCASLACIFEEMN